MKNFEQFEFTSKLKEVQSPHIAMYTHMYSPPTTNILYMVNAMFFIISESTLTFQLHLQSTVNLGIHSVVYVVVLDKCLTYIHHVVS